MSTPVEPWLRELEVRIRSLRQLIGGGSERHPVVHRSELASALAAIHRALTHVTRLDAGARPGEARRALAVLRRLPTPLGDAAWPVMPDPAGRELFRLYAGVTGAQRAALLVLTGHSARAGRGRA